MRTLAIATLLATFSCSNSNERLRQPAAEILSRDEAAAYLKENVPQFRHQPEANFKRRLHVAEFPGGFSRICYGEAEDVGDCWVIRKVRGGFSDFFEEKAAELFKEYDRAVLVVRSMEVTQSMIAVSLRMEERLYAMELKEESSESLASALRTLSGYSKRLQPNLLVAQSTSEATRDSGWGRAYLARNAKGLGKREQIPDLREVTDARIRFIGMNRASPEAMDGIVAHALKHPGRIASFPGARSDGSFQYSQWGATVDLIIGERNGSQTLLMSNGRVNELEIPWGPIRAQLKRVYR